MLKHCVIPTLRRTPSFATVSLGCGVLWRAAACCVGVGIISLLSRDVVGRGVLWRAVTRSCFFDGSQVADDFRNRLRCDEPFVSRAARPFGCIKSAALAETNDVAMGPGNTSSEKLGLCILQRHGVTQSVTVVLWRAMACCV